MLAAFKLGEQAYKDDHLADLLVHICVRLQVVHSPVTVIFSFSNLKAFLLLI